MKKKLNIESITNELEGASLFFTKSSTPQSLPAPEKQIIGKSAQPLPSLAKEDTPNNQALIEEYQDQKRTNVRTNGRTDERTVIQKREKIRHTFDIYKDQLFTLQMLQLEAVQKGKKKPKLGRMVSKGIDLFLKQAASKKK